jgi:2-polyprenyl-6-methoxyphenol hydroxylase-like FAD-dependent oxidoreductase
MSKCVIVGGGPGGVIATLLLARAGVPVTLLESHRDFDRDFRGDTIHPATLELLDRMGLAQRLHELPHAKMRTMKVVTSDGPIEVARFHDLRSKFPYVMLMPQAQLLEFLAAEARRLPDCRIVMGATVHGLLREGERVVGVQYDCDDGRHEERAEVTVAADGRFSKVRQLAGLEPVRQSPPMDVIWFRLPRDSKDEHDEGSLIVGGGHLLVLLGRTDEWQLGYVVPKGVFQKLKAAGLPALRESVARLAPWLAARTEALKDWSPFKLLSVESNRLERWHLPGLLLIGDAAHAMSPVGGVGINVAIGDAVETANVLIPALRRGRVTDADLADVERRRRFAVRAIQRFQSFMQRRIVSEALDATRPFRLPLPMRIALKIPGLRRLPAFVIAYGIRAPRLETLGDNCAPP